jgi:hypothetical protein
MGIPYPYFLVINHELITPTFMNFAKSDPGFVLLQPYSVKDLEVTDDNVTNVLATNREGDEVQISAHMIIACDGASSTVREKLRVPCFEHPYTHPMVAFFTDRPASLSPDNYFFRYAGDNGQLVIQQRMDCSIKVTMPVADEGIPWWKKSTNEDRQKIVGSIAPELAESELELAGFYPVRMIHAIDYAIGYDPGKGNYNVSYSTRFRYTHQNIVNSTLIGEDAFLDKKIKLDWTVAYSKAFNEVPENTTVNTVSTVKNNIENQISVVTLGGQSIRWEHNSDEDLSGKFNAKTLLNLSKSTLEISMGGLYRDKQRSNFFNEYDLRPFDDSKPIGLKNNLIKGVDWNNYSEIKYIVYNPYGSTGDPLNYGASEKIAAGYLQFRSSHKKYELNTGLRVENTNQGYNLLNPVAGVKNNGKQQYTDLLPSIHFKYILRVSYKESFN